MERAQFMKLISCPECGGYGGETEVILDDGTGPWWDCWLCEGEGVILPARRGIWLTVKRLEKKEMA